MLYLNVCILQASLCDLDDSSTDVSSTRDTHQDETGLPDAVQLADASDLVRPSFSLRTYYNGAVLLATDQISRNPDLGTTSRVRCP